MAWPPPLPARLGVGALLAGGLLGLLAALALLAGWPTVQALGGWFYRIEATALLPWAWLGVLGLAAAAAAWLAGPGQERSLWQQALLLALLSVTAQHGLAWAEGRGIDGLRDRALRSGHAEFVYTASRPVSPWKVLTRYEEFTAQDSQRFARTKPPGQLLGYQALDAVAQRVMPPDRQQVDPIPHVADGAHRRLADFVTLVLPWLAASAVLPLLLLGRALLPRPLAPWAALLYTCTAPVLLITLHFDQAVYPLLVCSGWACAAHAGLSERRALAWGLGAGALGWLALFVSFSLLPALLLAALLPLLLPGAPDGERLRRWGRFNGGAFLGLALPTLTLRLVAGYDPLQRYRAAMAHHAAWMEWQGGPAETLRYAGLTLTEFLYWLGIPVAALFLAAALHGLWRRRRAELLAPLVLALLLTTSLLGHTKAESARLWIFYLPAVAMVVTGWAGRITEGARQRWLLAGLALAQVAWAVLLKARQDFW